MTLLFNAMPELLLEKDYRDRVRRARLRAERLGLTKVWIAKQIDRSRGHTTMVLHEKAYGPPTLERIEALLDRIESGVLTVPEGARR
jgi:hypothetical protein